LLFVVLICRSGWFRTGYGKLAGPLLPSFARRPQGGGTAPLDERAVFTMVVHVLTSGCAWRHLPPAFDTRSTAAIRQQDARRFRGPGHPAGCHSGAVPAWTAPPAPRQAPR